MSEGTDPDGCDGEGDRLDCGGAGAIATGSWLANAPREIRAVFEESEIQSTKIEDEDR